MNFLIALTVNLAGMSVIYSLMAFAFAQLRWRRRGRIAVLAAILVAGQFWIVPALLVRGSTGADLLSYSLLFCNWLILGFSIIILSQAVKGIPPQLEDSARLDGCSWFGTYWHVLLPFVGRALCLIAFLTLMGTLLLAAVPPIRSFDPRFIETWLDRSLTLMTQASLGSISSVGLMMVISLVATLPMIVVFVFSNGPLLQAREQGG
jgi:ABC-type glycerol-3-phosphate transport system permease component